MYNTNKFIEIMLLETLGGVKIFRRKLNSGTRSHQRTNWQVGLSKEGNAKKQKLK